MISNEFGQLLRAMREERADRGHGPAWTQTAVAARASNADLTIRQEQVSLFESGRRLPSAAQLDALCVALDLSVDEKRRATQLWFEARGASAIASTLIP